METRNFVTVRCRDNKFYVNKQEVDIPEKLASLLKGKGPHSFLNVDKKDVIPKI